MPCIDKALSVFQCVAYLVVMADAVQPLQHAALETVQGSLVLCILDMQHHVLQQCYRIKPHQQL